PSLGVCRSEYDQGMNMSSDAAPFSVAVRHNDLWLDAEWAPPLGHEEKHTFTRSVSLSPSCRLDLSLLNTTALLSFESLLAPLLSLLSFAVTSVCVPYAELSAGRWC